jgi:hypothetical protein
MSCLGVFFGIDEKTAQSLEEIKRTDIVNYVRQNIEEVYFEKYENQVAEIDKAWDAVQRALSENEFEPGIVKGTYPSNMIVLGGKILYGDKNGEDDYIISLKNPVEVSDIYKFLSELHKSRFRELYFQIDEETYGFDVDEQDFEYTWEWLEGTVDFWKNAADKKLSVIFTVDQ